MEDSPVMGLLTGHSKSKSQAMDTEGTEIKVVPTEGVIKEAIKKRASYLKDNSDEITMAGVRQILEEDLELDKNTLHPLKKFISEQVDAVLRSPKVSKPKSSMKESGKKKEKSADSLDSKSEEHTKAARKRKVSDESKKRKAPAAGTKKRIKVGEENSDASEDGHSQSSEEKPAKKKDAVTPSYGKRVEHLKSVIKSCGMSVPPVVYKKAKQVPEDKREAFLRKELEGILSREGLSTDPSEKEIKDVKKRKERAKELEGIDMSNIVSSTRRRSTASFIPPPKPKITAESEDASEESSDDDGDSEDDNGEGGNDGEGNGSQSEEVNEDVD